jgi:hypothetical protein
VLGTEKIEIAKQAKAIPLVSETIPVVTVEASVDPVEETEAKSQRQKSIRNC